MGEVDFSSVFPLDNDITDRKPKMHSLFVGFF